jgi:hypothetical protein
MVDDSADSDQLPLVYKLILKVPKLSLDGASEKVYGIFWAVILPILVICEFLTNLMLLTYARFPFNVLSVILFNSVVGLFALRILVERTLNSEKAILNQGHFEWKVEETFNEYLRCLRKDEDEEEPSTASTSK